MDESAASRKHRLALITALNAIVHDSSERNRLAFNLARGIPEPWDLGRMTVMARKDGGWFTHADFLSLCALVRDHNPEG